jgi:hypothetical protein
MALNRCLLLDLPRELRDQIYNFCLDYPNIRYLLGEYLEKTRDALSSRFRTEVSADNIDRLLEWTSIAVPRRPPLSCPAVLLLNRQISDEAQLILQAKWLLIDVPIASNFRRDVRGLLVTDFVGDRALTRVRYARLVLSFEDLREANNWYRTINQLWNVWNRRNALRCLKINVQPTNGLERDHQSAITRKLVIAKVSIVYTCLKRQC